MAFLDDARQLAEQASRQIEQGIEQVRERIDGLQQQRRFGQLARDLGLMVYRSRRGGAPLDELEVERITAEMAAIEASSPASSGGGWPGGRQGPGPGPGPGPGGPGGERPRTTGPDGDEGGQDKPPAPPGGYTLDDI
ncbi:MAG TPA: hypothetical protein VGC06_01525 [Actinomycetes bacterium]